MMSNLVVRHRTVEINKKFSISDMMITFTRLLWHVLQAIFTIRPLRLSLLLDNSASGSRGVFGAGRSSRR